MVQLCTCSSALTSRVWPDVSVRDSVTEVNNQFRMLVPRSVISVSLSAVIWPDRGLTSGVEEADIISEAEKCHCTLVFSFLQWTTCGPYLRTDRLSRATQSWWCLFTACWMSLAVDYIHNDRFYWLQNHPPTHEASDLPKILTTPVLPCVLSLHVNYHYIIVMHTVCL